MTTLKLICAVALLSAAAAAPALAGHKHHRHHHHHHNLSSLYIHNFGPPLWPGEAYATYDGPLSALCARGAAAYRGQDGRRHPCH